MRKGLFAIGLFTACCYEPKLIGVLLISVVVFAWANAAKNAVKAGSNIRSSLVGRN